MNRSFFTSSSSSSLLSSKYYGNAISNRDNNNNNTLVLWVVGTGGAMASLLAVVQLLTNANPVGRCWTFWKQLARHEKQLTSSDSVNTSIDEYAALHQEDVSAQTRNANYNKLVNAYYDLATVFYEWGWGSCFHFSYQYQKKRQSSSLLQESFDESIRRHEYYLASQLNVHGTGSSSSSSSNSTSTTTSEQQQPEQQPPHILDVGCGIGGPLRNISRFLQARVTGITLNEYQVQRGNELTQHDVHCAALGSRLVHGDFMHLPFANDTFDGAYAIEATCHAPDRVACYREILRTLKPGATFCCYEWCMTDQYDPANPEHLRMKKDIEQGNGLPDICDTTACWHAMKEAGFELVTQADLALVPHVQPWYTPLTASWNPLSQRFQFNWLGAILTNAAIRTMELIRLAPKGTVKTQKVLQAGGFALRDAGREGIFTVMYLMVGKKPMA